MSTASDQANRRRILRRKVALPAILAAMDNGVSFDCLIRDLSETGAKLAVPPSEAIPEMFFIIDVRARTAHKATLIWQTKKEIGVQYQSTLALTIGLDRSLRFLNRLWLQRVARL